jgi:hypothetical protein
MSLGHGYDMVLLPPRHPTDVGHGISQPGGALRRYRRSRQARAARQRRARRNHRHRLAEGDDIPRSGASQPNADTDFLAKDLCRMSLAEGKMPTGSPTALPPGVVPPPAYSTTPARGTMPSLAFPYGLDSVARAYVSSVSTSMSAYEELPGHHLCSTLDLIASTPASEYLNSMETPDTEPRATASRNYNPRDGRPHMHPSYYYFGAPDSDSADDTYDPTRECFNIDGASASDSEDEAAVGGRNTPPRVELPAERDEAQLLADQGMQLEQIRELQDRLDEERENLRLLQRTLKQERAARTHGGGA